MKIKSTLSVVSLLSMLALQPVLGAANNIELSESDIIEILNGKIEKVQTTQTQATVSEQKPPVVQAQRRRPQAVEKPRYIAPARTYTPPRRVNHSSIPAWRRPAGHTMTRSADDALFGAAKSKNMRLLKQLIAEGANVNHQNFNGETALHIAASLGNLQMVKYLVSQGANINARTGTEWMPIHHAIRFNHASVANYLISRKALLHHKTIDGFTALDFAKKSKNPQIRAIARRYGQ